MKTNLAKLLAITTLAVSGCAMPYQQSATPMTPEQMAAITANNAEIDNANAERERNRIAEEALQVQRVQAVQQSIRSNPVGGAWNPLAPAIKVMPVNQFGQPIY